MDGPPVNESQTLSREELQERIHQYNAQRERFDVAPTRKQLFSPFTVFCLIMNRTIASGIFTQPVNVLRGAGSSGVALLLWVVAGLIILAIVSCWTELALTIPLHYVFRDNDWQRISAPRNGGDKNYLEYIFKKPRHLMTCIFGIVFIIFGNLAGNALQFGIFMSIAINPRCGEREKCLNQRNVVGWAVGVLTFCALLNIMTRRYAIGLNNLFAVAKVAFVFVIAILGIIYGSVNGGTCRQISWTSPVLPDGTTQSGGKIGDIALALFYAMYPYTGYEQPYYVLAEVSQPQRVFARATTIAMLTAAVLYPLTNLSYLCMTPYMGNDQLPENMAIAFFERLSGHNTSTAQGHDDNNNAAISGVAALLAFFIFGNLMAQTYTASRVKQEIAKEGILPYSLFFATGNDTLLSRLSSSSSESTASKSNQYPRHHRPAISELDSHREQAPIPATILHWFFEILLVLVVGLTIEPSKAYRLLTYLYTFIIVGVLGLFTAGGLLYLKIESYIQRRRASKQQRTRGEPVTVKGRNWHEKSVWQPWFDPLPAIVATVSLAFLLFAAFVPGSLTNARSKHPGSGNDYDEDNTGEIAWWIGPLVGWGSVGLGVLWWLGLRFVQWSGRWELETKRLPVVEIDAHGQAIQRAELVEHNHVPVGGY
ncbi:amino acid transporter [Rhypophila decipiens]